MKTPNLVTHLHTVVKFICLAALVAPTYVFAQVSGKTSLDYKGVPAVSAPSAPPLIMLAMSVDHELHKKAYTDYNDLDNDGELDTSYLDSFDYYGYFDSERCYTYSSSNKRFEPQGAAGGDNDHTCSGQWSGNFLNWATMTRIDIVRRVLYGGLRSQDDGETVLKRSYLPYDVHAFVKVFNPGDAAEVAKFTPYSQTAISLCNVSDISKNASDGSEPQIRVAKGAFPDWDVLEIRECYWDEDGANPSNAAPSRATEGLGEKDFIAQVQVCKNATTKEDNCKQYIDDSSVSHYKPIGLLQRYGEDGTARFGLMSGSYDKNNKGGMLRKNIMALAGNTDTDKNEVNTKNGRFINQEDDKFGIIKALNSLRIYGFARGSNQHYSGDCAWGTSMTDYLAGTTSNRRCTDWGNPMSEIYLEALRYFSGQTSPTAAYNGDDTSYISALNDATWTDPMSSDEWCANCAVVAISTGMNSYDKDDLDPSGITGLTNLASLMSKTNSVGSIEMGGSFAGNYIHGGSDDVCSSEYAATLSDIVGICPEVPEFQGGYHIAGLAYHAHTTDMRDSNTFPEKQKVDTYAIALSESLPSFSVEVGSEGKKITFLPFAQGGSGWNTSSMTNVKVLQQVVDGDGKLKAGRILITWEDSRWGGDYDLDAMQLLEFCTKDTCRDIDKTSAGLASDQLRIYTRLPHMYTGAQMRVGYIVSGSTNDGSHIKISKPPSFYSAADFNNDNASQDPPVVQEDFTAAVGDPGHTLLENPLFYTAKFGGYNDYDESGDPTNSSGDDREWDTQNNSTGIATPDGIPDNFFQVRNPARLETQLNKVLLSIISQASSGTAAAVVSNSASGQGALYQAVYYPKYEDIDSIAEWVGMLHGLFVDEKGNLREDTNGDGVLDPQCSIDNAIDIYLDTSETPHKTKIKRYKNLSGCNVVTAADLALDDDDELSLSDYDVAPFSDLKPIWNARDELGKLTNTQVVNQRSYNVSAGTGRHILTSLNGTSLVDFDADTFTSTNFTYLDVDNEATADNVVNFVRGKDDISGFRNRSVNYDESTAGDEVWRLGDIVSSSPIIVAAPNEGYEISHSDTSYATFKSQYADRRHVVIVGANDGMIHAFNGGFWDDGLKSFKTSVSGETAHPLGSELWGYVPRALLPHLKWLKEQDYPHVYYMDGEPIVFDAKIFTADADHPDGWGTVLVMGMRFGGGPITVDVDGDGLGSPNDSDDITLRSSYVVLDITNPEVAPKLIAEISHEDLGYTTGIPDVVIRRHPGDDGTYDTSDANEVDDWYLVFGSGPDVASTATSTKTAKLYGYDLKIKTFVAGFAPLDLGEANSFVGNPASTDWDNDFKDDIVYFGIAGGTEAAPTGKLMRLRLDTGVTSTLIDSSQPFLSKPVTKIDSDSQKWVMAGTGRYFVPTDSNNVLDTEQQSMYGVKEPIATGVMSYATVATSSLVDVSDVKIYSDGYLLPSDFQINSVDIDSYTELYSAMKNQPGWKIDFPINLVTDTDTDPNTRNVTDLAIWDDYLIFTDYTPGEQNSCDVGSSRLSVVNFSTGTAEPFGQFGLDSTDTTLNNEGDVVELAVTTVNLGPGLSSKPVIHGNEDGTITVFDQGSGGGIDRNKVRKGIPGVTFDPAGYRRSWQQIDFTN